MVQWSETCQCSKLSVHMQKKLTHPYTPYSGAIKPVPNKLCERIVWWGQRKKIEPQSSRKDYRERYSYPESGQEEAEDELPWLLPPPADSESLGLWFSLPFCGDWKNELMPFCQSGVGLGHAEFPPAYLADLPAGEVSHIIRRHKDNKAGSLTMTETFRWNQQVF